MIVVSVAQWYPYCIWLIHNCFPIFFFLGAGVFGALTHIEIPKFGGKHKKTAEDFFGEVNW